MNSHMRLLHLLYTLFHVAAERYTRRVTTSTLEATSSEFLSLFLLVLLGVPVLVLLLHLHPVPVSSVTFLLSVSASLLLHMLDALKVLFILTDASTYLGRCN